MVNSTAPGDARNTTSFDHTLKIYGVREMTLDVFVKLRYSARYYFKIHSRYVIIWRFVIL
mgnify:FL=1